MFSKYPVPSPVSVRPQRILLIRFFGTSGVIETIPVIAALRQRFPKADIALLTEKEHSALLNGHPALDRLIFVERGWHRTLRGIKRLRQRLQMFKPDAALDFQGRFRSALAAYLSGAKTRVGFSGKNISFGNKVFNNILFSSKETDGIERNLTLLEIFGITGTSIAFDLPECETDKRNTAAMLNRHGLNGNFAVIHAGYSKKPSFWTEDRMADISKELLEQWNLPSLVVCADEKEMDKAEMLVSKADGAAYLVPKITLPEFALLARRAVITAGTCPELLAAARAAGAQTVNFDNYDDVQSACDFCDEVLAAMLMQEEGDTVSFEQEITKFKAAA